MQRLTTCLVFIIVSVGTCAAAENIADLRAEVEKISKEIAKREESAGTAPAAIGRVEAQMGSKYGPNAPVSTKVGKLKIGGLVQVWFQQVSNDNLGIVSPRDANDVNAPESNEVADNDTFRIRRTELRFTLDIHENITAYVMIDPSREHNPYFYPVPTYPRHNSDLGPTGGVSNVQFGALGGPTGGNSIVPRLLQDVYFNVHDVIPHHELVFGQFKPPAGMEAWKNSGQLEFVERAMVSSINNVRDIGLMIQGSWLDDRVTYALGLFNGPSGTVLSDPELTEAGNRSDDNDEKDFAWRVAVRPVFDAEKWYGRLELGVARTDGVHGESGQEFDVFGDVKNVALNAINTQVTDISKTAAWVFYRPGGPVRGWWLKGEWGSGRDRFGRNAYTTLVNLANGGETNGNPRVPVPGVNSDFVQGGPTPVNVQGWYFSTGYRLSESVFADRLDSCGLTGSTLKNMEFAFRYEVYENVSTEDLNDSDRHTNQFKTQAYTFGLNYYIKGNDAKIQANYVIVDDPSAPTHGIAEVDNNVFVLNFQVGF
jgi:hypothetical protein